MSIEPFLVEQWMNAHETTARWNIAETCVDSLTLGELLELAGDQGEVIDRLLALRLGYGDIVGSPALRGLVAALYAKAGPDQVLAATGAIGANYLVHAALVERGDVVVSVSPTYQQLESVPRAAGADVRLLRLREENGYLPDPEELASLAPQGTRLIVLNNPNNPTGALIDADLLGELVAVAERAGAYIHCDEVYRGLEHDPSARPPSIVDVYEKGISTGSISKAYSLAGLRTGWIVGPLELVEACCQVRDYTTISCGVVDDVLSTLALSAGERILARSRRIVAGNARLLGDWVAAEPRVRYVAPRAGTTALIHYDHTVPSRRFCEDLFRFNGTFVTPGDCFGLELCFRVGYASSREVLEGGLAGLSEYLRTLE